MTLSCQMTLDYSMKSKGYTSVMGFEWDTDFAKEIKDLAVVSYLPPTGGPPSVTLGVPVGVTPGPSETADENGDEAKRKRAAKSVDNAALSRLCSRSPQPSMEATMPENTPTVNIETRASLKAKIITRLLAADTVAADDPSPYVMSRIRSRDLEAIRRDVRYAGELADVILEEASK